MVVDTSWGPCGWRVLGWLHILGMIPVQLMVSVQKLGGNQFVDPKRKSPNPGCEVVGLEKTWIPKLFGWLFEAKANPPEGFGKSGPDLCAHLSSVSFFPGVAKAYHSWSQSGAGSSGGKLHRLEVRNPKQGAIP